MARNPNQIDEDQSIAALRDWWDGNGKSIVAAVITGIAIAGAWLVWDDYRLQQTLQASDLYAEMITTVSDAEAEAADAADEEEVNDAPVVLDDATLEALENTAASLERDYPDTVYAPLATMLLAKQYVAQDQLDKALGRLDTALNYARDQDIPFLQGIITIRIARIMTVQGKHKEALDFISDAELPRGLEQLGLGTLADNFAATGEKQVAADMYRDALESLPDPSGYLLMKLQQLGVSPTPKQEQ